VNRLQTPYVCGRGVALLVVLWTLALLALIGTQLVGAGRGELLLARNLIDAASVQAATDGGVVAPPFNLVSMGAAGVRRGQLNPHTPAQGR